MLMKLLGLILYVPTIPTRHHREKNKNNFERRDENGKELILYLW